MSVGEDSSMSDSVRLSIIQLSCDERESAAQRTERALSQIASVAPSSDVVMLPELWHVGAFDIAAARVEAQPIDGPLVASLAGAARSGRVWLHGGSFAERAVDGRYFNTSVLFNPDGDLVAVYRKIHLFGFTGGETTLMSAGDELVVVETPLGTTGLATCYDLRFPEMFRGLVDKGAQAVLLTSGWPTPRVAHWTTLTRARAIENQMFIVACNEVGNHAGTNLAGHSVVVDPMGTVIAEAAGAEDVLRAEIDPSVASAWRDKFPVLADRRLVR